MTSPSDITGLFRRSDPQTSAFAAGLITNAGIRAKQTKSVLMFLIDHPNSTSAELAKVMRVDRYMTARRLPELEKSGFAKRGASRKCTARGTKAITWRATL